jgi:NAD-dependent deacetylase
LEAIRQLLRAAADVAVLTGAGISAESGIPTFRGAGGLWRNFRAEDLATPSAFQKDPELVWEWYRWRRELIAQAQPNPGHLALVALENRVPRFTLITQNVDGLHERAGSRNVLRLHGSIWEERCFQCGREAKGKCTECGGITRPGVVWFGEGLDPKIWDAAEKAVTTADVVLVIGTSAAVYPAASLAPLAKQSGAKIIEVNPDETPISSEVDYSLRGPAGIILPRLIEMIKCRSHPDRNSI